jgi:hypothetical protein
MSSLISYIPAGQQDEFAARLEHVKNTTYLMLCKSLPNRRTIDNESVVYR